MNTEKKKQNSETSGILVDYNSRREELAKIRGKKIKRQASTVCISLCLVAIILQLCNEIQCLPTPQSRPTGYSFSQHPHGSKMLSSIIRL